jgi:hypothetical protein
LLVIAPAQLGSHLEHALGRAGDRWILIDPTATGSSSWAIDVGHAAAATLPDHPIAAGGNGGCTIPYGRLEGGIGGGTGGSGTEIAVGGTSFEENFSGSGGGGARMAGEYRDVEGACP